MSPFFLKYGYNIHPITLVDSIEAAGPAQYPKEKAADALVEKMRNAVEYAQAALAAV